MRGHDTCGNGAAFNRQDLYDKEQNEKRRKEYLKMLLEIYELAQLRNERYKALIARVANKKVNARNFPKGPLVLRWVERPKKKKLE